MPEAATYICLTSCYLRAFTYFDTINLFKYSPCSPSNKNPAASDAHPHTSLIEPTNSTPLRSIYHLTTPHHGHKSSAQATHARIPDPLHQTRPPHLRPPLRIQHPRMALHPHRASRDALRRRPILGHPRLPTRLPLRTARNPHAHTKRQVQMQRAPLPQHQRLPP